MVEDVGLLEVGLVEPTVRRMWVAASPCAQHHDKGGSQRPELPRGESLRTLQGSHRDKANLEQWVTREEEPGIKRTRNKITLRGK